MIVSSQMKPPTINHQPSGSGCKLLCKILRLRYVNNEPLNDGAQSSWVRVYADAGTKHPAFFVWGSGEVSLEKGFWRGF